MNDKHTIDSYIHTPYIYGVCEKATVKWLTVNINEKFSKRLRHLRKKAGLTQVELAAKAGIDYKYLQKLEGKSPSSPTIEVVKKLSLGLKKDLVELFKDL